MGDYLLFADGKVAEHHESQEAALKSARKQKLDSFEIWDDDRDIQVYVEWPQPKHSRY